MHDPITHSIPSSLPPARVNAAAAPSFWRRRLEGLQLRLRRWALRLHPPALDQLHIFPLCEHYRAQVQAALPGVTLPARVPDGHQVLVCWLGEQPVGVGHVAWQGPRRPGLARTVGAVAEIHQLHVAPLYRSLGIGTRLIARFEQHASARGLGRVGLGVAHANARAAALYARLGYRFVEGGQFVDEFDDALSGQRHRVPCHYMVKPLRAMAPAARPLPARLAVPA